MRFFCKTFSILLIAMLGLSAIDADALVSATKSAEYVKRPKVALVLCGGGAKGAAHVGVLKVLEQAGIKPDMIIGTSIGGIVGGIYSLGYNAYQLDSIIRGLDWEYMLSDNTLRKDMAFKKKMLDEMFFLQVPIYSLLHNKEIADAAKTNETTPALPSGLRNGQNILNVMSGLAGGYQDSIDFKKLPIPFACIATNLVTGEEVVLDNGLLPLSMRATMAIPGYFAPVDLRGKVLVDGGMVNNFPVDVAKKMGADIVIGVDIQSDLSNANQLYSINQVLGQIMTLMGNERYLENVKQCDIYIKPDVTGFTTFSFSSQAVDSLIVNGYAAAKSKLPELISLKKKLDAFPAKKHAFTPPVATEIQKDNFHVTSVQMNGIGPRNAKWLLRQAGLNNKQIIGGSDINKALSFFSGTKAFSSVTYQIIPDSLGTADRLIFNFKNGPTNIIGLGLRFDTEEMAAILLYLGYRTYNLSGFKASLTGRLSYNPYGQIDMSYVFRKFPKMNFSYKFQSSDMNIYQTNSSNHLKFYYNMMDLSFSNRYMRNFDFLIGARFEAFNFTQFLTNAADIKFPLSAQNYLSYYASMKTDSRDSKTFPTRGVLIDAEASFYQTNFHSEFHSFGAAKFNISSAIPLGERISLLPSLYTRILIGHAVEYAYLNFAGGTQPGRYMSQQIPFIGINYANVFRNSIAVAGLELRGNIAKNHYVYLQANELRTGNDVVYLFNRNGQGFMGFGLKYAYSTLLGPLSINVHWSDYNKKVGCYVNFGYYF